MDYVLEIQGGIGKHIMATSLIKWLNEKNPKKKITIISAYPELFEYNPRVWRNLRIDQPYLYEDYIDGKDYRKGEPYNLYEYYHDKMHLCEVYPKAYRFNSYNKDFETEIYLTKGEEMDGQMFCQQNQPVITFQPLGGLPPGAQPNRMKLDSSQRDMPPKLAMKIVMELMKRGFKVLQLRGPSEAPIQNTLQLQLPFRNLLPIIKHSVGHVGIDSSGMHASAVFKKPQLIFWGHTHKDNLGYKYDGVMNCHNEHGMHCRPHCQLPDRTGLFPYKDKKEGFEFDYTDKQIEEYIEKFVNFIKKNGGENGKKGI